MKPPSCFGLPSVFNARSQICTACSHRLACIDACKVLLREIRSTTTPDDPAPVVTPETTAALVQFGLHRDKGEKYQLTDIHKVTLAKLPVKVAPRYESMVKNGLDRFAVESLSRGENPFKSQGARFLQVACEKLLEGPISKPDLRDEFVNRFIWSEGTAASHVSICVALLPAIDVAVVDGNRLVLSPNLRAQS